MFTTDRPIIANNHGHRSKQVLTLCAE